VNVSKHRIWRKERRHFLRKENRCLVESSENRKWWVVSGEWWIVSRESWIVSGESILQIFTIRVTFSPSSLTFFLLLLYTWIFLVLCTLLLVPFKKKGAALSCTCLSLVEIIDDVNKWSSWWFPKNIFSSQTVVRPACCLQRRKRSVGLSVLFQVAFWNR
jgi:hypothetical protein